MHRSPPSFPPFLRTPWDTQVPAAYGTFGSMMHLSFIPAVAVASQSLGLPPPPLAPASPLKPYHGGTHHSTFAYTIAYRPCAPGPTDPAPRGLLTRPRLGRLLHSSHHAHARAVYRNAIPWLCVTRVTRFCFSPVPSISLISFLLFRHLILSSRMQGGGGARRRAAAVQGFAR